MGKRLATLPGANRSKALGCPRGKAPQKHHSSEELTDKEQLGGGGVLLHKCIATSRSCSSAMPFTCAGEILCEFCLTTQASLTVPPDPVPEVADSAWGQTWGGITTTLPSCPLPLLFLLPAKRRGGSKSVGKKQHLLSSLAWRNDDTGEI